jgi:hypothetical protein
MLEMVEPGAAKSGQGFLGIFGGNRNANPSVRAS